MKNFIATLLNPRTQEPVGEFAAAQRETSSRLADARNALEPSYDPNKLARLEDESFQFNFRIQSCDEAIRRLEPELENAERKLGDKRQALGLINAIPGSRNEVSRLNREIESVEHDVKDLSRRLDARRLLLQATQRLQADWQKRHGKELIELRRLDTAISGRAGGYIHREGSRGPQADLKL